MSSSVLEQQLETGSATVTARIPPPFVRRPGASPTDDINGPAGRLPADLSRGGAALPAAGHPHHLTRHIFHLDSHRVGVHDRWSRGRDTTRPGMTSALRLISRIPPCNETRLLHRPSPPCQHRSSDGGMPKEALNASDASFDSLARLDRTSEEAELATGVGNDFAGGEAYQGDAGARSIGRRGHPSLELPSHPVHHRPRRERPVRPPPASQLLGILGRGLDEEAGAGKATRSEPAHELFGDAGGDKGQRVDLIDR